MFLGMSFNDNRFTFTRRTCLAAAKTIINEMKEVAGTELPNIWVCTCPSIKLFLPLVRACEFELLKNIGNFPCNVKEMPHATTFRAAPVQILAYSDLE